MLTEVEQLAIESMVNKGLKLSTIKRKLGKHGKEVEEYVSELDAQLGKVDSLIRSGVLARLAKAGINGSHADELMNRTLKQMDDPQHTSVEELYNACISMIGARELIKTTSDTGAPGVAVMTGEASVISNADRENPRSPVLSRKARPVIYRPKTGKMASDEE